MSETAENTATLGEELRNIVDHAEALLHALADDGDASLGSLRDRVSDSIESARARLREMESDANGMTERAAAAFERWARNNPWTVVAMGVSVGLVAGMLLAGRRRRAARADSSPQ
ncbi:MAG: DUF883 family protein [Steroidobacteraceae bacterium]